MNKVILTNARLVRDVEIKKSGDLSIGRFTVALNRQFDKEKSDFINCVAFGKRADTIAEFFQKGSLIALEGKIQTGSYEKDGRKINTFDVVVDSFEFVKGGSNKNDKQEKEEQQDDLFGMTPINDDEEDLPF